MTANYNFTIQSVGIAREPPAIGDGSISLSAPIDLTFIPHGTTPADDLLAIHQSNITPCLTLIRRGTNSGEFQFPEDGTVNVDYWARSRTNIVAGTGSSNCTCFIPHPTDSTQDLLAVVEAGANLSGTSVNFIPRGTTVFPGGSIDNINRYKTAVAELGNLVGVRQACFAPDPADPDNDLLVVPILNTANPVMLLRRTSGSIPFPGSASPGTDRIELSKTNIRGSGFTAFGSAFIPHPTDSELDLLCFGGTNTDELYFVKRGGTSTSFPGGTLGTDRWTTASSALGNLCITPNRLSFSQHPTDRSLDTVWAKVNNGFLGVFRGDTSTPFPGGELGKDFILVPTTYFLMDEHAKIELIPNSTNSKLDLLAIASTNANKIDFGWAWQWDIQPFGSVYNYAVNDVDDPISVGAGGITLSDEVDYFTLDRTVTPLIDLLGRSYSWTRSNDTEASLTGDLIFDSTADITGNYQITIEGASVTLGSKATYETSLLLDGDSTLILTQSTELTEDFVLSNGTTVAADDGTGPYTLTIPYPDPGLVLGTGNGSITLVAPTTAIDITGIPDVPNAILAVVNLATSEVTFPSLSGGGAVVTLDAATNYQFVADAPGYLAQRVTLSGATPAFEFTLPDYRAIYEAGTNRSAVIGFNYNTLEVLIGDGLPLLSFADVFRTIEDYLSTPQGVLFPNPPFPVVVDVGGGSGRNYLFFPYDQGNDTVNPVVIRPNPANTLDPMLSDFVIVLEGATAPLFDIFDFSLAGGRTIRFQTEAVSALVQVSGGLSSGDRAVLDAIAAQVDRLDETLASPGVFSSEALANTPTDSGGGLGPDDIARLERIENQLIADVRKGASRFQRLLPGTETVILDKDVAFDLTEGYVLTEHAQP